MIFNSHNFESFYLWLPALVLFYANSVCWSLPCSCFVSNHIIKWSSTSTNHIIKVFLASYIMLNNSDVVSPSGISITCAGFVQKFDCGFPWFSRIKLINFQNFSIPVYINKNTLKISLNAKHKFNVSAFVSNVSADASSELISCCSLAFFFFSSSMWSDTAFLFLSDSSVSAFFFVFQATSCISVWHYLQPGVTLYRLHQPGQCHPHNSHDHR